MRTNRLPLAVALALGLPLIAAPAAAAAPLGTEPRGGSHVDHLVVIVDHGDDAVTSYRLACDGSAAGGGTHPQAQAACEHLEGLGGPVASTPPGRFCTQMYGGSHTARITGTWHGAPVDASYNRRNGCEMARWDKMHPVLPDVRTPA